MKLSKILSGFIVINLVFGFFLTSAHAVQFTGCLKNGKIKKVAIGATPQKPCKPGKETEITWNTDGPAGVDGLDGLDGLPGADGAQGLQGSKGDTGDTGPPGGPQFVVLDSDTPPKEVGTVIDIRPPNAVEILLEISTASGTRNVFVRVSQNEIETGGGVFFSDPDCTGDAFGSNTDLFRSFLPAMEQGLIGKEGDKRRLFLATGEPIIEDGPYESTINNGICNNISAISDILVPVVEVNPDLFAAFPPSYTLELQ